MRTGACEQAAGLAVRGVATAAGAGRWRCTHAAGAVASTWTAGAAC